MTYQIINIKYKQTECGVFVYFPLKDLVMLLLQHNADVCIINGEGRLPRDMCQQSDSGREIAKLLRAAEETEALKKESKLLSAAREGNITELNNLVR